MRCGKALELTTPTLLSTVGNLCYLVRLIYPSFRVFKFPFPSQIQYSQKEIEQNVIQPLLKLNTINEAKEENFSKNFHLIKKHLVFYDHLNH